MGDDSRSGSRQIAIDCLAVIHFGAPVSGTALRLEVHNVSIAFSLPLDSAEATLIRQTIS